MKTKKTLWILGLATVGLGTTATVLLACGMASVSGRVTSSFSGEPLNTAWEAWVDLSHEDCCCQQDQLSEADAADGKYRFSGVCPGNYNVSAWAYGYQSESASISVSSGASVTHDFALDPVAANIAADVTGLDAECGSFTGGYRQVKVAIRYQEYCHYPQRLVVWAYSALTGPVIIYDNGTSYMDFYYLADPDVTDNPAYDGYDTTYHLSFFWNTLGLPNTSFTLKAYLRTGDPHGDGTDIDPDPNVEQWVHEVGTPPDGTTDGTAGGTTVTTEVKNIVITDYYAVDTPVTNHEQDAFRFDPGASPALSCPSVAAQVEYWDNEAPIRVRLWVAPTAWADTRPTYGDPTVDVYGTGQGTYTLLWDGVWTDPESSSSSVMERGTYTFDIDAYAEDYSGDHFYAKTHDGWNDYYDVKVGEHNIWWQADTTSPPAMDLAAYFKFTPSSMGATDPFYVEAVGMDDLEVKNNLCLTAPAILADTGGLKIHYLPVVYSVPSVGDTLGFNRVLFTGQAGSGGDIRRDGKDPRILTVNMGHENPIDLEYPNLADDSPRYAVNVEANSVTQLQPPDRNELNPGGTIPINIPDNSSNMRYLLVHTRASTDHNRWMKIDLTDLPGINIWATNARGIFNSPGETEVRDSNGQLSSLMIEIPSGAPLKYTNVIWVEALSDLSGVIIRAECLEEQTDSNSNQIVVPLDDDRVRLDTVSASVEKVPTYLFANAKYWTPITFKINSSYGDITLDDFDSLTMDIHTRPTAAGSFTATSLGNLMGVTQKDESATNTFTSYINPTKYADIDITNGNACLAYFTVKARLDMGGTLLPVEVESNRFDPATESPSATKSVVAGFFWDTSVFCLDMQPVNTGMMVVTEAEHPEAFHAHEPPTPRWETVQGTWDDEWNDDPLVTSTDAVHSYTTFDPETELHTVYYEAHKFFSPACQKNGTEFCWTGCPNVRSYLWSDGVTPTSSACEAADPVHTAFEQVYDPSTPVSVASGFDNSETGMVSRTKVKQSLDYELWSEKLNPQIIGKNYAVRAGASFYVSYPGKVVTDAAGTNLLGTGAMAMVLDDEEEAAVALEYAYNAYRRIDMSFSSPTQEYSVDPKLVDGWVKVVKTLVKLCLPNTTRVLVAAIDIALALNSAYGIVPSIAQIEKGKKFTGTARVRAYAVHRAATTDFQSAANEGDVLGQGETVKDLDGCTTGVQPENAAPLTLSVDWSYGNLARYAKPGDLLGVFVDLSSSVTYRVLTQGASCESGETAARVWIGSGTNGAGIFHAVCNQRD